jgi:hypothetical protein
VESHLSKQIPSGRGGRRSREQRHLRFRIVASPNRIHGGVRQGLHPIDAVRAELSKVSKLLERGALEDRWHQISILSAVAWNADGPMGHHLPPHPRPQHHLPGNGNGMPTFLHASVQFNSLPDFHHTRIKISSNTCFDNFCTSVSLLDLVHYDFVLGMDWLGSHSPM